MKRYALGGLALAVAVAMVALIVASRSGSSAAVSPPPATPDEADEPAVPAGETPTPEARPELPDDEADAPEAPVAPEPDHRRYVREDGIAVRDHRSGDREPDLTRAIPRPKEGRRIDAGLMVRLKNAVRPHVHACTDALPEDAFGDDPRLQGEVIVSIVDGQLVVDEMFMQTEDVRDDGLVACVQEAVADVGVPAGEHEPLEAYTLTMPFRLRR